MSLSSELMGLTLDRLTQSQSEITEINDQIAKAGSKSQVDALKEERRIALEAIKDQKARATEQFKVNKSLRIAEAIMGTASAAAQALASPPGPPTTIPLAALAAALGAVQIARIANEQPSFHQGGMVTGLQPDERSAVLRTGDKEGPEASLSPWYSPPQIELWMERSIMPSAQGLSSAP
jgi:hypothetical protein